MEYDELVAHGSGDFDSWRLEHRIAQHRGAAIEAVNRGDNTIAVTTRNVVRFTVWLHPRMVDVWPSRSRSWSTARCGLRAG